ncbi:MAG TPA: hypothetical protein VLA43_13275 [Longimicrobiales bacterium]|nr:hypothetical protein [Longimicrobiales bacterium]
MTTHHAADTDSSERYRARGRALDLEGAILVTKGRRLSVLRSSLFLGALALWVAADLTPWQLPLRLAALAVLAAFFILVRRHRRVRRDLERVEAGAGWVAAGRARLDRRWDALPAPAPQRGLSEHPYAVDLDVFGPASLAALLGPVHTPPGRDTLEGWLLEPSPPEEVSARQEAVRELAEDWVQREAVAVEGALLEANRREADDGGDDSHGFGAFLSWCGGAGRLPGWLAAAAWVLPVLLTAAVVSHVAGWTSARPWVVLLFVQAAVAFRWGARLHAQFALASTGIPGLRRYHAVLERWEGYPARTALLRREVERLGQGDATSSAALAGLERLLHLADLRLSSIYPAFAVAFLWDVHVARGLLGWRRRHGAHVAGWMEALGTLEALAALGTLAGDHPEWVWPVFADSADPPRFTARELGHPLLSPAVCVRNDVELGPPGTVLLVTGSNMSGKSTLLRSVGLAAVMAGAGLPVCARALRLPPVRLFTSMRVQDSLEAGVSYFMAELLRLKALLDAASPAAGEAPGQEPPLLYLVDEILQGTNSEERQLAGRRLIRHLLRRRAIGAVTTHDLELHRDPAVQAAAVLVHFREALDEAGEGLHFDYRLRPGLATTRNALKLAERVGLTDPDA